MPSTAAILNRLHRAGWSLSAAAFQGRRARIWVVSGRNGENQIRAIGETSSEAWKQAAEQARLMGMLGTGQGIHEPFES